MITLAPDDKISSLYHRKRIYFSSTLRCNKKEEKNHQTSHFEHARPFQSSRQLWARVPLSINQATLSVRAPFNQSVNFEHARPFQPARQEFNHLHTSQHMAWDLLLLPAPTADSTLLPTPRPKESTHPPYPFWAWCPLMRPHGLHMAIRWYHRRSDWSQDHNGCYFSSWKDLTVKKSASKSSAVSAQEGGILYWPACWVAYKRNPGRPQSPVCSQWSTPPHPSWTQPELHYLDTVCGISKFSIVNKCHFPWARPCFHQSGKHGRAPFKWARPSQVSMPLSINQANLSAPHLSERTPFHQSGKLERALLKRALSFLSIKQWVKNLAWMEEWPNRDQLPETERGITSVAPVSCLSCSRLRCWRGCAVVDGSS